MQTDRFLNVMRLQSLLAQNARATVKLGIISSYSPDRFSAKVKLQPYIEEGPNQSSETGFLPIASAWAGNNWGLFCAPPIGSQCIVIFQEGSWDAGIIIGSLFSLVDNPLPVQSGEFFLVHKSGSFIKLTNDGKVTIKGNAVVEINAPATNISVNGGSLKKLITDSFKELFNTHTHGGPVPDQQMDDSYLTASLKTD